jgi:hypothetical protein
MATVGAVVSVAAPPLPVTVRDTESPVAAKLTLALVVAQVVGRKRMVTT